MWPSPAGLIALALSVSVDPLTAAMTRFPSDVGAPLLEDQRRDDLIWLVTTTFILAIGLLLMPPLGLPPPIVGSALCAVFATLTLTTLTSYVRQRIRLIHPSHLSAYLANEALLMLFSAARPSKPALGRSVLAHTRLAFTSHVKRLEVLCRTLLTESRADEGREVLQHIAYIYASYSTQRRFLDTTSEWFPQRDVPVSGFDLILSPIYENLALGPASRLERDLTWFERRNERSWSELLDLAVHHNADAFVISWVPSPTTRRLVFQESGIQFTRFTLSCCRDCSWSDTTVVDTSNSRSTPSSTS